MAAASYFAAGGWRHHLYQLLQAMAFGVYLLFAWPALA